MRMGRPVVTSGDSGVQGTEVGGGVVERVLMKDDLIDNIATMCQQAGIFFEHVNAQYHDALRMFQVVLDSALTVYGVHHPHVSGSFNNIRTVYETQGKYDDALVQNRNTLEIKIRTRTIWVLQPCTREKEHFIARQSPKGGKDDVQQHWHCVPGAG
mmetsp:Transcript_37659/g.60726  ORF Transcript_37659/g.60726 Transcript_37659/m.60726 type:complete len:156 (-) Transcript_37659:666-1133(-)